MLHYPDREHYPPESRLCFEARMRVRDPDGSWRTCETNDPIYHVSGAEYHSGSGIKFFEQDSVRKSHKIEKNKQDPPTRQPPETYKNENKYKTTCKRCGVISHRSFRCPTYPFSHTRCGICNRFHKTKEHREPGQLEI